LGGTSYVFDNAATQTPARFAALATIFDPGTVRHLMTIGVADGWHCLEVGGGGGSIASWLCDRVGPTGRVIATDIDTRFLETLDKNNLEVLRHDLVTDPLPQGRFDLVHTRLVLMHLPEREQVLARLAAALKPGGWLVAEEFDSLLMRPDPAANLSEAPFKTLVMMQHLLAERGVDLRYGRLLARRLRTQGLRNVAAEGRVFMWSGRSVGGDFLRASIEHMREAMIESERITAAELEHDLMRLDDDDFLVPSSILWAAWGRRCENA
jgi:SAM-dependent methyltransferase